MHLLLNNYITNKYKYLPTSSLYLNFHIYILCAIQFNNINQFKFLFAF
jgi:hypothetical protein